MDKQKRSQYKLTGSIHTVNIKSNGIIENIQEDVSDCVYCRSHAKNSDMETTSVINPNKLLGNLYTYSEFQTALDTILAGANITDCNVRRAAVGVAFSNGRPAVLIGRYLIASFCVNYHSIMFCCSFHNRVRGNFIIQNHRCPALRFSL